MSDHKNIIIIGGGIVGCSVAYHLGKRGHGTNTMVIEKGELTSGSTWHAAGLVGQLRSSRNITHMLKMSVELYESLESETGQATGWRKSGGLRIAGSKERMQELKRAATTAKSFGFDMHLLTPSEALELFPIMETKGIVGAGFLPTDGYADPSMITNALAKGARNSGVTFKRHTRVLNIELKDRCAKKIITDKGDFDADIIVNTAGMWAAELGKMVGVHVPLIPVEHQYLVTEVIPDLPKNLPTMRDPDHLVYYKEEAGGLVMGGYEPNPIPWSVNGIPKDFGQELLESNFDQFAQLGELAVKRTPILESTGVRKLINGPEAFTPDGNFVMGRAPELENFYVAAGFNAHGIAAGGGAGRMLAEWILDGVPSLDLWSVDIRRFGEAHQEKRYVVDRTLELYGKHYTIHWPYEEHQSARDLKRSPLYDRLKAAGAQYGTKFGWERPNWFGKPASEKEYMTFETPTFFENVEKEHHAIRTRVALLDQTSFSKLEITGKDAGKFLNYLCDANINKPDGALIYTQFCNERGGIEADLTVAKINSERFYLVTGTAFGTHDFGWIDDRMSEFDGDVVATRVSKDFGVINVCGPNSRKLLEKAGARNISHEEFPFATCQTITLGNIEVLALRVTYVGELGWELHIPIGKMIDVYDLLWENGKDLGIANAGYYAIDSCRLEKGFRYWSTDITPDYTPYEAGLGFCVALKAKSNFIGRELLSKQKAEGVKRKLCCFTLAEPRPIYGGETIKLGDQVVDVVTSGGYGYTVKKTICYGYVPTELIDRNDFTIEVMGETIKATREKGALYDPKRERVLC